MCEGPHPFIPAANVARATINYRTAGGIAKNVLHFQFPDQPDVADLTALATNLGLNFNAEMRDTIADSVEVVSVEAVDLTEEGGTGVLVPQSIFGTRTSGALPNNVTGAVKFSTGFTGRSRRGRMYLVGMTEDMITGDTIAPAIVTQILESINSWIEATETDSNALQVIVSYCSDGDWRADALVTTVSGRSLDATVDSQRRRLSGRGT